MAEGSKKGQAKKRQLKKTETVRERAERTRVEKPKRRIVRSTASKAGKPVRAAGKKAAKVLSPLSFLLAPFKTKPARVIGKVLAAIFLLKFFREAWHEIRQVNWPTAKETARLSMAVFVFSVVFGAVIAVTDYGLDKVFKKVFID